MKFINSVIIKSLQFIEFLALSLILISNILFNCVITGDEHIVIKENNIITSILYVFFIGLIIFICFKLTKRLKTTLVLILTHLTYAVVLLFWIYVSRIAPVADQESIYISAINFNAHKYADIIKEGYLYQYNHQVPLAFMFSIFLKVFGGNYKTLQIIIALFSLGLSLGLFKLTKGIFNEVSGKTCVFISMMFIPTILLTTYVYGDIIGLCLSIWAIYFTILFIKEGKLRFALFSSILIGIAILFRYNTLIVWIAMGIYIFIRAESKKFIALIILITSLSYSYGIKEYMSSRIGTEFNRGIPTILFINMGLEEGPRANGWYNGSTIKNYEDVNNKPELAKELGLKLIKNRISYMRSNPLYTRKFFTEKFITTWAEPTHETLFFTFPFSQNKEITAYYKNNRLLNSLYYGDLNNYIILYCKGFILFVCLGSFLHSLFNIRKTSPEIVFLLLSVVGTVVFHLIWETKSRYIFPAFVLLFPLAAEFWVNTTKNCLVTLRRKFIKGDTAK